MNQSYQNIVRVFFFVTSIILISCSDSEGINENENNATTIVDKFGQLSTSGNTIVDQNNNPIALRGMSLFWSQWAPDYYNKQTIKWLLDDFKCTVIRAPLGVEPNGYLENQGTEYQKITAVIDACIELGIYVIVDWHDHHAEDHFEEAKSFFDQISKTYSDYPNIIYEIYNEPLDVSWSNVLKPYSEGIIETIRENDPNNLIVVGTPNWSQDVDDVVGSILEYENIAYSLHFYTGSHKEQLRAKAEEAISANIPLFVTEWGLSEADATGDINIAETNLWVDFMENHNLSWCNWSVNNKAETTSILKPSTSNLSNWNEEELTEAGKIIRDYLILMNGNIFESLK